MAGLDVKSTSVRRYRQPPGPEEGSGSDDFGTEDGNFGKKRHDRFYLLRASELHHLGDPGDRPYQVIQERGPRAWARGSGRSTALSSHTHCPDGAIEEKMDGSTS